MTADQTPRRDAEVREAIEELRSLIESRYPDAHFELTHGPETGDIYLIAIVEVEDTDDVMSVYTDRLVELQIEKRLPVYVMALRPWEHVTLPQSPYHTFQGRNVA